MKRPSDMLAQKIQERSFNLSVDTASRKVVAVSGNIELICGFAENEVCVLIRLFLLFQFFSN